MLIAAQKHGEYTAVSIGELKLWVQQRACTKRHTHRGV